MRPNACARGPTLLPACTEVAALPKDIMLLNFSTPNSTCIEKFCR